MRTKIIKNCDVCGNEISTYEYGGGTCKNCGWIDDIHQAKYPDCANANNMISLNRARELWRENKKFLPSFTEALSLINRGFDLRIKYKGVVYLVICFASGNVEIIDEKESKTVTEYVDIPDFAQNAKIGDEMLSEIWSKLKFIEYGF